MFLLWHRIEGQFLRLKSPTHLLNSLQIFGPTPSPRKLSYLAWCLATLRAREESLWRRLGAAVLCRLAARVRGRDVAGIA